MGEFKKAVGKSFEEMFGDAQEFVPNPKDMADVDFSSLDEEDFGGEEELEEIDCADIEPANDLDLFDLDDEDGEDEEDDEDFSLYDECDLDDLGFDLAEEDNEEILEEGLGDGTSLVTSE